jgi:hypothetical protein
MTMRTLDGMPGVEKTSVFGTAVHAVVTEPPAAAESAIRRQLESRGVRVESVTAVQPSLEDVFLEVVERAG